MHTTTTTKKQQHLGRGSTPAPENLDRVERRLTCQLLAKPSLLDSLHLDGNDFEDTRLQLAVDANRRGGGGLLAVVRELGRRGELERVGAQWLSNVAHLRPEEGELWDPAVDAQAVKVGARQRRIVDIHASCAAFRQASRTAAAKIRDLHAEIDAIVDAIVDGREVAA